MNSLMNRRAAGWLRETPGPTALATEAAGMNLDLSDLAAFLHPQELELLAEIADELEEQDELDSADEESQPSRDAYLRAILGAPSTDVPDTRAPKSGKKKKREPRSYELEYYNELDAEVEAEQKHRRRLPAVLTRNEVRQLLEAAKAKTRDYMIIRMLYATGCRRSELENMRLADLHLDERKIFIRSGKNDVDRYVLLDEKTASLLDDFVYGRALDDPIFDVKAATFTRVVQKWGKKTGLYQRYQAQDRLLSAHALRHCFATHLHESGVDPFMLRDLLGHRYLTTTRTYILVGAGRRVADYDQHHPLREFELD